MKAQDIIIRPVLTEKAYAGIANKVYTFKLRKYLIQIFVIAFTI